MTRLFMLVFAAVGPLSAAALAGEVSAITPADFDGPAAHWLWSLLASYAVSNLLVWALATA